MNFILIYDNVPTHEMKLIKKMIFVYPEWNKWDMDSQTHFLVKNNVQLVMKVNEQGIINSFIAY